MAVLKSFFFDKTDFVPSQTMAADFANWLDAFVTDGVRDFGTNLQVTAGNGMSVNVHAGCAKVNGRVLYVGADINGADYNLSLTAADATYQRVDRIVMRKTLDPSINRVILAVLTGSAGANPQPPALTRTNDVYEMSLARVLVPAHATSVAASNITDERTDTALCGQMNSVLGLDPSTWQAQFDAFMTSCASSFTTAQTSRDSAFTTAQTSRVSAFSTAQTARDTTWTAWFNALKIDLERYAAFNFDNVLALSGVTYQLTAVTNGLNETIKTTSGGAVVAERKTAFSADGSVTYNETLYASDNTVLRGSSCVQTFDAAGGVKEVVA